MFVAFETVALRVSVAPCCTVALDGVTETVTGGLVTVIFDLPYALPRLSELVDVGEETRSVELATTRYVPGAVGAVYNPVLLTVPPSAAVQATVPVADEAVVSWTVPPGSTEASAGETPRSIVVPSAAAAFAGSALPGSEPPHAHRRRTAHKTPHLEACICPFGRVNCRRGGYRSTARCPSIKGHGGSAWMYASRHACTANGR